MVRFVFGFSLNLFNTVLLSPCSLCVSTVTQTSLTDTAHCTWPPESLEKPRCGCDFACHLILAATVQMYAKASNLPAFCMALAQLIQCPWSANTEELSSLPALFSVWMGDRPLIAWKLSPSFLFKRQVQWKKKKKRLYPCRTKKTTKSVLFFRGSLLFSFL